MTRSGGDERVDRAERTGDSASDQREQTTVAADRSLDDLESHLDEHRRRLDRLESLVEDQRGTIERQRERIATLEKQFADGRDSPLPSATRRTALKAGGLVGLLGLGVGTASADPQGQVGTGDDPIETLHAVELGGPLTGGQRLASLTGEGLVIANGELTVSSEGSDEIIRSFQAEATLPSTLTADLWVHKPADGQTDGLTVMLSVISPDGTITDAGDVDVGGLPVDETQIIVRTDDATDGSGPFTEGEHTVEVQLQAENDVLATAEDTFEIVYT